MGQKSWFFLYIRENKSSVLLSVSKLKKSYFSSKCKIYRAQQNSSYWIWLGWISIFDTTFLLQFIMCFYKNGIITDFLRIFYKNGVMWRNKNRKGQGHDLIFRGLNNFSIIEKRGHVFISALLRRGHDSFVNLKMTGSRPHFQTFFYISRPRITINFEHPLSLHQL